MRICHIWDADYPWDIRIEKVSESLVEAGHCVHLVCRNAGRLPRSDSSGTFHIRRLPAIPAALGPLHAFCNFPCPVSPFWIFEIARVVRQYQVDLILVRDLPLSIAAILVGVLYRIPVVLDMAENYPAMLRDRLRYTPTTLLGRIIRHPILARLIERVTLQFVDHVIVVVDESRDRLIATGVSPDQITVATNTPRIDQWNVSDQVKPERSLRGGLHIVYLGNLDGSRGVDTTIRAFAILKQRGIQMRLSIIGQGPSGRILEELIVRLDLRDQVVLKGRLPFREVQATFRETDIGLIPHYSTEAWNTTMPNKLFDYMLWRIPVVVSDVKPVAAIVRSEKCGEVFKERDPDDLARCILALTDPKVRKEKGENGRAAIYRRYNWKVDVNGLIKAIEAVHERNR